jgi:hypothetical protein
MCQITKWLDIILSFFFCNNFYLTHFYMEMFTSYIRALKSVATVALVLKAADE